MTPRAWRLPPVSVSYLVLLLAMAVGCLLAHPITFPDADTWFHLSSGRYIFEHHAVPREAFFSFLTPTRPYPDYAWLFQVITYRLYTWWGYYGLIGLRGLLFLSTAALVFGLLVRGQPNPAARGWAVGLCVLYLLVFLPRSILVRPYLFTYLCAATFLYVLERHPRRAIWLVPVALAWCNLHGISYPILVIIASAYLAEYFWLRHRRSTPGNDAQYTLLVPLVLCLMMVYLTPLGFELLAAPFRSIRYFSIYINELKWLEFDQLVSLNISRLIPTQDTVFSLLFLAVCCALVLGCSKSRGRISHLLLCAGGFVLLFGLRAARFRYEFVLLTLPLLQANPLVVETPTRIVPRRVVWLLAAMGMAVPILAIKPRWPSPRPYPFDRAALPEGVATFLTQAEARGRVLNTLNSGGYMRWRLYPRYTIFADLESSPFTDDDLHVGLRMFKDPVILEMVLARYDPSFISVPVSVRQFKDHIKAFPRYVPIFADDSEVLFVNRRHYPAIAQRFELKAVDPFDFVTWREEAVKKLPNKPAAVQEVRRMLDVYPTGGSTNRFLAILLIEEKAYDRALPFAQTLIQTLPSFPVG